MKLLIDSSTHGKLTDDLIAAGYDVSSVASIWPEDPGDTAILAKAFDQKRIVITRDKDFGELAVLCGQPHCGIIRLWDTPASQQFVVCNSVLKHYGTELSSGAIVTASPYRVRVRPPMTLQEDVE